MEKVIKFKCKDFYFNNKDHMRIKDYDYFLKYISN